MFKFTPFCYITSVVLIYHRSYCDKYSGFRINSTQVCNKNIKTIHFVRHAEGHHNVAGSKYSIFGYLREDLEDAELTEKGIKQCQDLNSISELTVENAQLLVVSPLRRTIQTATHSFPQLKSKIPWIALECIREQTGLHPCDRRRPISEHKEIYNYIDFTHMVDNEDILYRKYRLREPHSDVQIRIKEFMLWLKNRPETEIIVVSHQGYLYQLFKEVIDSSNGKDKHKFRNAELRTFIIDFSE